MRFCTPTALSIGLSIALLSACKADKVKQQPETEDAGAEQLLPIPTLESPPVSTPNNTVAIRGSSEGKRVLVQGGPAGTTLTSILPGGNFCTDVELEPPGQPTSLTIYAMGDGLLSDATILTVTKDATAPAPSAPTCSGSSPEDCDVPEVCDNEEDDNCDGWVDNCDLGCNDCVDDDLEPNDFTINVPIIEKGDYNLTICPCRDDWFAFQRNLGQRIRVTANFTHAQVPINLRLYKADPAGDQGEYVTGSFSATDQESIDEVVDATGLYYLRVYAFGTGSADASGDYQLTVD